MAKIPFKYSSSGGIEFDQRSLALLINQLTNITIFQKKLSETDEKLIRSNKLLSDTQNVVYKLDEENVKQKQAIDNYKIQLLDMETKLKNYTVQTDSNINTLVEQNKKIENDYRTKIKEIEVNASNELSKLTNIINEIKNELKMKDYELNKANDLVDKYKSTPPNINPGNETSTLYLLKVLETKVNTLDIEKQILEIDIKELKIKLAESNKSLTDARSEIIKKDEEYKTLTTQFEQLKSNYEKIVYDHKISVDDNTKKMKLLRDESANLKSVLSNNTAEKTDLIKKITEKTMEIESLRTSSILSSNEFQKNINNLNESIVELKKKIDNYKSKTKNLEENNELLKKSKLEFDKSLSVLQDEINTTRVTDLKTAENNENIINILLKNLKSTKTNTQNLESTVLNQQESITNLMQNYKSLMKQLYSTVFNPLISTFPNPSIFVNMSLGIPPICNRADFDSYKNMEKFYKNIPTFGEFTQELKILTVTTGDQINNIKLALKLNQLRFDGLYSEKTEDSLIGTFCFDYTYLIVRNTIYITDSSEEFVDINTVSVKNLIGIFTLLLHAVELAQSQFSYHIESSNAIVIHLHNQHNLLNKPLIQINRSLKIRLSSEHFNPTIATISVLESPTISDIHFSKPDEISSITPSEYSVNVDHYYDKLFFDMGIINHDVFKASTFSKIEVTNFTVTDFLEYTSSFGLMSRKYKIARLDKYNTKLFNTNILERIPISENSIFRKAIYVNSQFQANSLLLLVPFFSNYVFKSSESMINPNLLTKYHGNTNNVPNDFVILLRNSGEISDFLNETFLLSIFNGLFIKESLDVDKIKKGEIMGHLYIIGLLSAHSTINSDSEILIHLTTIMSGSMLSDDYGLDLLENLSQIEEYKLFTKLFFLDFVKKSLAFDDVSYLIIIVGIINWELYDIKTGNNTSNFIFTSDRVTKQDKHSDKSVTTILDILSKKISSNSSSKNVFNIGRTTSYGEMIREMKIGEKAYDLY